MMDTFETLRRLTETHGVSGNEGEIRALIRSLAEPFADDIREDVMGNLIVHKQGNGPKLLFAAHMDSIGLIATHINEQGYVQFGRAGGFDVADLIEQPVRFQNGTYALCCAPADKVESGAKLKDLYLDVGAKDQSEAKELVKVGDTAVYVSPLKKLGTNRISGCYLDNRLGCLALLQALEQVEKPANDLYFVFTTQEELGMRGAKTVSFDIDPDYGVAVDVTLADDVPGSDHTSTCKLGEGVGVKIMDYAVICHRKMVEQMNTLAKERSIPVQADIMFLGGTDAGVIHTTRSGVVTGGLSIPCRYTHSAVETCDLTDYQACVDLIRALCETKLEAV